MSAEQTDGPISASATPSRRPQACERCWKRKQKCDRRIPTCSTCAEAKAHCSPRQIPVEPSEDNTGLSHGALPGYIDSLKQRIQALEALSQRKRQRVVPGDTNENGTPELDHESNGGGLDSSVQAAMGEIGFLSRSAMAEPRDGAVGFPRQLAMHEMLQAVLNLDGGSPALARSTRDDATQWDLLAGANPLQTLSAEKVEPFLRSFLEQVNLLYVCFDRKELEDQCEAFFADTERTTAEALDSVRSYRDFSVCLTIAIGISLTPQSGQVEMLAQSLHSAAVKLLPRIIQSGSCTSLIHALILLTLYSTLNPTGGSAWHLVGLAIKRCVAFGLHKEQDENSGLDANERAKRSDLFWALYFLDRMICTTMGRPFSIEDEDITLVFPEAPSTAKDEVLLEVHLLMHARLISNIRNSNERCPVFHYRNVCFWREVPLELVSFLDTHQAARDYIQQLSCRALIQILPLCLEASNEKPFMKVHAVEVQKDIRSSCEQMIDRMYRASDRSSSRAAFTDGYDVFAAGVAIISTSDNIASDATVVNKCTALLTSLGGRFAGIKVFRRVLLALSDFAIGRGSDDVSILHSLPSEVPIGIRTLIQHFLRKWPGLRPTV